MKTIVFTVTNDLDYDQRMQRICTSLAKAGYDILLVGRKNTGGTALQQKVFRQKRLHCFCKAGFIFYAEYNLRLFLYLLFTQMDVICAIDLDTILPCYYISLLRRKKRVYDAHELFTEMKEVITRPVIKRLWRTIEKITVPNFSQGYTVSYSIAGEFKKRYNVSYEVIRNMPVKKNDTLVKEGSSPHVNIQNEKVILYQGAVNEARGLENLVDAMQYINAVLHIYGDGNMYGQIKFLINKKNLQNKIILKGKLLPEALPAITQNAFAGINLVEPIGLNQVYSLANKFFDYIQAAIPQVTMNFPEYKKINEETEVAVLINTVATNEIAGAINLLLNDEATYQKLKDNCLAAREMYTWQHEEQKLLCFYKKIFTV